MKNIIEVSQKATNRYVEEIKRGDIESLNKKMNYVVNNFKNKNLKLIKTEKCENPMTLSFEFKFNSSYFFIDMYSSFKNMWIANEKVGTVRIDKKDNNVKLMIDGDFKHFKKEIDPILKQAENLLSEETGYVILALFDLICPKRIYKYISNSINSNSKYNYKIKKYITITPRKYEYKVTRVNPRKYTFHVESWNVSGHYRRYKNGKVVWVKEYKKGKKSNVEDKNKILI